MCFSNLFIANSAAANMDKHVSLWCADSDSLVYIQAEYIQLDYVIDQLLLGRVSLVYCPTSSV